MNSTNLDKDSARGERKSFRWGASRMKGWPNYMEDFYLADSNIGNEGLETWACFGIFDGHGTDIAAKYLSQNLATTVLAKIEQKKSNLKKVQLVDGIIKFQGEDVKDAIYQAFFEEDDRLKSEVMRKTPEFTDDTDYETGGSTASVLFLTRHNIYAANCGDSRTLLVKNGIARFLTKTQKPTKPKEHKRILDAGSFVINQRVNAVIAVSRSFGDFEFKNGKDEDPRKQAVIVEPYIKIEERSDDCELIILASDGVWDVFPEHAQLFEYVKHLMQCTENIDDVCNQVMNTCYYKGSRDNMSMVIVAFNGVAPQFSQEAADKEKEADEKFYQRVTNYVKRCVQQGEEFYTPYELMVGMSHELCEDEMPFGGIAAKRYIIEKVFSRSS